MAPKRQSKSKRPSKIVQLRRLARKAALGISKNCITRTEQHAESNFKNNLLPNLETVLRRQESRRMDFMCSESVSDTSLPIYFRKIEKLMGAPFKMELKGRVIEIRW